MEDDRVSYLFRDTAAAFNFAATTCLQRSNIVQGEAKRAHSASVTRVLVVVAPSIIDAKDMRPGDAPAHRRLAAGMARGLGAMQSSVQRNEGSVSWTSC